MGNTANIDMSIRQWQKPTLEINNNKYPTLMSLCMSSSLHCHHVHLLRDESFDPQQCVMYAKVFPDSDMSKEESVNTKNVNRISKKTLIQL